MRYNNNRNRKAQIGNTVTLLLILAGALVLYLFISKVTAKSTFEESINACRLSVVAQTATEIGPTVSGRKSPFDINCDKRYIKFQNTKVEVGLNPTNMKTMSTMMNGQKLARFKNLNEYTVNQVIAEEMRICKFQFADGKIEVFANDEGTFSNTKVCFVCSEITFDNKISKEEYVNLLEYTQKTLLKNEGKTYYDYLTELTIAENPMWGQVMPDKSVWEKIFSSEGKDYSNINIDTKKTYAIFIERIELGTTDIFHWNEPIFVAIRPVDELNKYCDLQAS